MAKFSKTDLDITKHKPKMKPFYIGTAADLKRIPAIVGKTTVQAKADGEFSYVHVDRQSAYAVNRFGRKTEGLPALNELHTQLLKHTNIERADLLGELYAVDPEGKPLPLPKFIHVLKGCDEHHHVFIRLGLFDFIRMDGERYVDDIDTRVSGKTFDSGTKLKMLEKFNGKLVSVLPWKTIRNGTDLEKFYTESVQQGWEGAVVRTNGDTYKAKPNRDIDAVIIGINKSTKGFDKGLAKSVKVALMSEDGNFVELGDATVPTNYEAAELFHLTRVAVRECPAVVFVKPLVIVTISYISLFPDTHNAKFDGKTMREIGTTQLVRMKSPRVTGYRKDKKVCVEDVGFNQLEE